jgi:hypothetical protein
MLATLRLLGTVVVSLVKSRCGFEVENIGFVEGTGGAAADLTSSSMATRQAHRHPTGSSTNWDYPHDASFIRIASSVRADRIFGKDSFDSERKAGSATGLLLLTDSCQFGILRCGPGSWDRMQSIK